MGGPHSGVQLQFVQAIDSSFAFENRPENLKTGPVKRKAAVVGDYLSLWVKVGIVTFIDVNLSGIVISANA